MSGSTSATGKLHRHDNLIGNVSVCTSSFLTVIGWFMRNCLTAHVRMLAGCAAFAAGLPLWWLQCLTSSR